MKKPIFFILLILIFFIVGGIIYLKFDKPKPYIPFKVGANFKEEIPISSVRVINSRFPSLTNEQFDAVVLELEKNIKYHLGVQAKFYFKSDLSVEEFFKEYIGNEPKQKYLTEQFLKNNRAKLKKNGNDLFEGLKKVNSNPSEHFLFKDLINYFTQSIPKNEKTYSGEINTTNQLLKIVSEIHLKKFKQIQNIKLNDGESIFEEMDYHEIFTWESYLVEYPDYEFIITNQPLISIKDPFPNIHTSLRGGIASGFATRVMTLYGSVVVISTFPFIFQNENLQGMRDYKITSDMVPRYIGSYATHEFGHSLAYWGHYFEKGCIMNPARGLKFKTWYEETKNKLNCNAVHKEDLKEYFLAPFK